MPGKPYSQLKADFEQFHENNPRVYEELLELAFRLHRAGRKRYGIGSLFEVLRWHRAIKTHGSDFKMSNNHRAFYARLIMENEPELEGFFQVNEQPSERAELEWQQKISGKTYLDRLKQRGD